MRAVILGAGVGRRLGGAEFPPKVLLSFGGETLLARHVAILRHCGIARIELVVGYRAGEVEAEIARIGAREVITTRFNADYEEGPIVSLWALREAFIAGEPVLFMDGDVLYDHRMMERLIAAPQENCFLMDRTIEEGEDPVRLCLRDGVLVDFHKRPQRAHDWWGEWVGFCRFAPGIAAKVAAATARYIEAGRRDVIYEEAFRDVVLAEPPGSFGVEDITGLPWVEIDFPEDLEKAKAEVFPSLVALPGDHRRAQPRTASAR
ncbi:MAG: NTP transferase domain-containing protein [Kiloniellaceae bacterium]